MTEHTSDERAPGGTDARVAQLEAQVRALADALRALISGLEDVPAQERDPAGAARGARMAHELLIAQGL